MRALVHAAGSADNTVLYVVLAGVAVAAAALLVLLWRRRTHGRA